MLLKGTGPMARQHVRLFEKWDTKRTGVWVIQEGSTATDMNRSWYSLKTLKANGYLPWQYKNIR